MRDLYTHSMQRTGIVDAMLNEDVEAAREGFKKVYYHHMGKKAAPRTKAGGLFVIQDPIRRKELSERLLALCQKGLQKLVRTHRIWRLVLAIDESDLVFVVPCVVAANRRLNSSRS